MTVYFDIGYDAIRDYNKNNPNDLKSLDPLTIQLIVSVLYFIITECKPRFSEAKDPSIVSKIWMRWHIRKIARSMNALDRADEIQKIILNYGRNLSVEKYDEYLGRLK